MGRKTPNFIPCQENEKWQWLVVSMWHLVEISEEIVVYAYENALNFKLEPRCFYGNSTKFSDEKCCEFSDKFFYLHNATLEMIKGVLKFAF